MRFSCTAGRHTGIYVTSAPRAAHCQLSRVEYYTDAAESSAGFEKLTGVPFGTSPPLNPGQEYDVVYQEGPPVLLSFKEFATAAASPVYIQNQNLELHKNLFFHQHDFIKISYVVNGTCFHLHNRDVGYLFAGDLIIIPPGVMHAYVGPNNLDYIDLLIYPELLPRRHMESIAKLAGFSHLFEAKPSFNVQADGWRHQPP